MIGWFGGVITLKCWLSPVTNCDGWSDGWAEFSEFLFILHFDLFLFSLEIIEYVEHIFAI